MTDEQVNRIVQHLREQLHLAVRLKGTEAFPPNAKDLAFDAAIVRTVLLTGLRLAGGHNQSGSTGDKRRAAVVLTKKRGTEARGETCQLPRSCEAFGKCNPGKPPTFYSP